jgi:hypothetical protein
VREYKPWQPVERREAMRMLTDNVKELLSKHVVPGVVGGKCAE